MADYVTEQKHKIVSEKQEPTFYSRMPKMAIMDLDPYELALYANYKQTAGDNGQAWKSNATLAKECKMSIRKVQECRKALEEKGFIKCTYITDENGVITQSVHVTILDIWKQNHERYTPAHDAPPMQEVHTPHAGSAYPPAHDAPKEEPVKKNQKEELSLEEQSRLALVKKELKQYGAIAEKIAKLSLCVLTGKDKELNLDTPMTDSDFMSMMSWWDKKKDSSGEKLARPSNLKSFRRNALIWQEENQKSVQVTPRNASTVPSPTANAARAMSTFVNQKES